MCHSRNWKVAQVRWMAAQCSWRMLGDFLPSGHVGEGPQEKLAQELLLLLPLDHCAEIAEHAGLCIRADAVQYEFLHQALLSVHHGCALNRFRKEREEWRGLLQGAWGLTRRRETSLVRVCNAGEDRGALAARTLSHSLPVGLPAGPHGSWCSLNSFASCPTARAAFPIRSGGRCKRQGRGTRAANAGGNVRLKMFYDER